MLKRLFCNHEWYLVEEYWTFADTSLMNKEWWATVYCPKCRKKTNMRSYKYKEYIKIKEINLEYSNSSSKKI